MEKSDKLSQSAENLSAVESVETSNLRTPEVPVSSDLRDLHLPQQENTVEPDQLHSQSSEIIAPHKILESTAEIGTEGQITADSAEEEFKKQVEKDLNEDGLSADPKSMLNSLIER